MNALCTPPVSPSLNSDNILTSYGLLTSRITTPFFRVDAPSRVKTPIRPSADTFTSFTVRASTVTVSMMTRFDGSVTSQKYASPLASQVPVTAKSRSLNSPTPCQTHRSEVNTSVINP